MLIDLYIRLERQKSDPGQSTEAFMTAWRIVHLLLRLFYINKLCDDKTWARMVREDGERTGNKRTEIAKINNAKDRHLFGRHARRVVQMNLEERLENNHKNVWSDYDAASTLVRHYFAHGKVYVKAEAKSKSIPELTASLENLLGCLDYIFAGDHAYDQARRGAPAPPIVNSSYDASTGLITITEDEDLAGMNDL